MEWSSEWNGAYHTLGLFRPRIDGGPGGAGQVVLEVVRRTAVGAEQMGVSVAVTVVGELGRLDVVVVLVEGHVDAVARVGGGDGGQRWVIAI